MSTKHVLFGTLAFSVACFGGRAVQIDENPEVPQSRWQGALVSPPNLAGVVQVGGIAWMATGDATNETRVQIDVDNAAPGGRHPWEVRRGRCGAGGEPFGVGADYEPLQVGGNGEASATATINVPLPRYGEYSVEVLASVDNRDLMVACANLAPPMQAGAGG